MTRRRRIFSQDDSLGPVREARRVEESGRLAPGITISRKLWPQYPLCTRYTQPRRGLGGELPRLLTLLLPLAGEICILMGQSYIVLFTLPFSEPCVYNCPGKLETSAPPLCTYHTSVFELRSWRVVGLIMWLKFTFFWKLC